MPPWPAEESPLDLQLAALKRAKQKLQDQLIDRDNELQTLRDDNSELKKQVKEATYQAQQEARQASQAQELLIKKTDAYNNLKIQKDNAETALLSSEATVKDRDGEIKKLTYQLEVTSVRSATAANSAVAEEKAALEKRVHQLAMELQKAQLELEKEKENRIAPPHDGKAAASGSKIARPPSRNSIAPTDSARGRFGFQAATPSTAKSRASISASDSQPPPPPSSSSSIRPPSVLSNHHSSIPGPSKLPARRPSVSGSVPTAVNTSAAASASTARIAHLESALSTAQDSIASLTCDAATARATIATLERDLDRARDELSAKKDHLLRVENGLLALERSSREELDAARDAADSLRDDAEIARDEAKEARDELAAEVARVEREARAERDELDRRVNELVGELEGLEGELERREGEREDLVRMLSDATARVAELEETLADKDDECVELENELAYLEETHAEAMDDAKARQDEFEAELAELRDVHGRVARQEREMEGLEGNREELERLLDEARTECNHLRTQLSGAEAEHERLRATADEAKARDVEPENPTLSTHTLEADLAILEAELFKKDTEIDSLSHRLSQLEDLAADRDALAEQSDSLAAELDAKVQELASVSVQLEEATAIRATTREDAERHEALVAELRLAVSSLTGERAGLVSRIAEHEETVTTLESELGRLRPVAVRSHDDAAVELLEEQLSAAQEEVVTLRDRLEDLENGEWASNEASKDLQDRIATLERDVARLEESLETERGATLTAELDLGLARKSLDETREQLEAVEGALELETKAREDAERVSAAGLQQVDDPATSGQVEELEQEIDQLHAQLDDVRATAEDDAFAHLQEVTDLQLRLRGQENQIEDFQRELTVLDALRHILGETEARVDSLGWDLKAAHSATAEQRGIAEERIEALAKRFEASEDECLRLRTELDDTRHKLSDARDALDQAQVDLAASTRSLVASSPAPPASPLALSPSPTSLSFAMSPGSDPTVLVTRLREERDELRSRLDFARTEADFRVKALQKRLEESEQTHVRALSIMEVDLLDKSAALEHECDTNARIEEALRLARTDKARIEEELDSATRDLRAAVGKVDEFEKRLAEADRARDAHETARESAWALEGELDAATKSADTIRSQLDAANEAKLELSSSLDSLRADLRHAAAELDRQHVVAAESSHRIAELEAALATAREQEDARQSDALADFASLCETLESDVNGLRTRIAEQTAVITEREKSISLLQLNLAVRVAIDDDADELEADEGERSFVEEDPEAGDRTIAVEPSSSPSHLADLEIRLSEELAARRDLESQLASVQEQLDAYRQQAATSSAALEDSLELARQSERDQQERSDEAQRSLDAMQRRFDEVEAERDSLVATVESLRSSLAALESLQSARDGDLETFEAKVTAKHAELVAAEERILALESTAATEATTARERVESLERQLSDIEGRLSQALSDLAASTERAQLSETSLAVLQGQHSTLGSDFERLKSTHDEQQEREAEAAAGADTEIARLAHELAQAGESTVLYEQALRRISVLEEQLAAAQDSLSSATSTAESGTRADEVSALTARLEAALREIDEITTLLEQERKTAALATAAADEAVYAEKEAGLRAKAAGDRAAKEIQTLRQLGRASQAEAEALSAELETLSGLTEEVVQLRTRVGELETHIDLVVRTAEEEKTEAHRKKQDEFEEMLVCLQKYEGQIGELNYSIVDKVARIEELERVTQQQMEEIDEANENLIEALKVQKKHSAQIERLKSKIATLQRDLVQAKSTPPPPAPAQTETASLLLSNKKRRAPAEFDPPSLSSTSPAPAPRAIVASRPASLSSTTLALDKENSAPSSRPRPASSSSLSNKVDSVVPLKPEHQPAQPQRTALRPVDENSTAPPVTEIKVKASATSSSLGGGNAKLDALKAKLAAQKKRTRSGLSTAGVSDP
ncbi:hypothetical protein JCM11491_005690 [Sporobolomyces phaffii]